MEDLFDILRKEARQFGPALARTAYERGLAVTAKDGSTRPIPITATPVVIEAAELERRARLSARLASAVLKMTRAILGGDARELLLGALSPLERTIAEKTWRDAQLLATTRVDFFVANEARPFALELNATIPAMQGYSDIAAQSFIEIAGRHFGLRGADLASLQAKNRPNALPLYQSLLDGYALLRGGVPARIGLLCRRHDAQLTELGYLTERFREFGADAEIVYPDQLSGTEALLANGKKIDLVYRHLFIRRLEEPELAGAAYVRDLLSRWPDPRALVLNPPASQLEVKTGFALLSHALEEEGLAGAANLTVGELEAIAESVPWTRPFRRIPGTDPDRTPFSDLVARVAAEPGRFVLKRAWDYGGRAVFVGRSEREASFDGRVRAAYGKSMSWPELCARCAEDPVGGGFVVQELVETKPVRHLLCSGDAQLAADLYVDFSAYASVGLERAPAWGGVCRGSPSHIVNIVGGGGVLPLLTREVAEALLAAAQAR